MAKNKLKTKISVMIIAERNKNGEYYRRIGNHKGKNNRLANSVSNTFFTSKWLLRINCLHQKN